MIDLRRQILQSTITVNGKVYEIHTDYRYWLDFEQFVGSKEFDPKKLFNYFVDEIPETEIDWQIALVELSRFFLNSNDCPKSSSLGGEQTYDFIIDGEYIYSAFIQIYNIDLLETKLHWHKFLALFRALPSGCKMTEIMGFRSWRKSNKTQDTIYQEAKNTWKLPKKISKEKQELIDEINKELNG